MVNRRTLFGNLLAGAAAFIVAPVVRVEAATTRVERMPRDLLDAPVTRRLVVLPDGASWEPPPTFEAMQTACAALGHTVRFTDTDWIEHHMTIEGGYRWAYFDHWNEDHQGVGPTDYFERVDVWRRSLYAAQTGV